MPDINQESKQEEAAASPRQPKRVKIHTMPEKFYIEDTGGSSGKGTMWFVIILIAVIAAIGGGAYFAVQYFGDDTTDSAAINDSVVVGNSNEQTNTNAPVNEDSNVNDATNTLTNANQNLNSANQNLNTNGTLTNLFPNTNSTTNTVVNVNAIVSSRDSDFDGLTDIEETLYNTSITIPDTDGDNYADGQELTGGYDPNGVGSIESSSMVRRYTSDSQLYSILHPASWDINSDPQNATGMMFTTDGEFVEVIVESNPSGFSARDWYLKQSPGVSVSQIKTVTNWDGTLSGVKSVDGSVVYFVWNKNAYVINYNTNILSEANYKSTFEMMYGSFKIVTAPTTTNTNSNANTNSIFSVNTNTNSNTNSGTNSNVNTTTNTNVTSNTNLFPN